MEHRIRAAGPSDAAFLVEMAREAANWHPERTRTRADLLADADVVRHVRGWQRPADGGVIALDEAGDPVGACWFRVPSMAEAGQGFVGAGVPELVLGVRPPWRARGLGRALLVAACTAARDRGHQRVSLVVHRDNVAQRLARSEGFVVAAADAGGGDVMVRTLR